jgi:hypothetical protein
MDKMVRNKRKKVKGIRSKAYSNGKEKKEC